MIAMKKTNFLLILAAISGFVLLSSHDLFLKAGSFKVQEHSEQELALFNGTFEKSENSISRSRIVKPVISGPDYMFIPGDADWYDKNDITWLRFRSGGAGTYLAGISTLPRSIELTADEFNEYLEHDGILDVLEQRKTDAELGLEATESYAKHVKAIIQVADKHSDHYARVLGYPVEFVPLSNPYLASEGEVMTFRLLQSGNPLAGQLVYYRNTSEHHDSGDHHEEGSARTDEKGEFSVKIDHEGIWYLRTIHMVKSEENGIDYVSNWATLCFEIE